MKKMLGIDEAALRKAALEAAERSGIREGLPRVPPSAKAFAAKWAAGEISADEAVEEIAKQFRQLQ